MRHSLTPALVFLVICLTALALASSGDKRTEYTGCVSTCQVERCNPQTSLVLLLSLRMTRWTCTDDCKYLCMHELTDRDVAWGHDIHQYYGKWPFWRFSGMQEPASVAFSMLNLWAHAAGGMKIWKNVPASHVMRPYYLIWCFASINAWVWSSVFHTRDTPITEKLDYFSAALAILYALYYTTIRLFHLYPAPERSRPSNPAKSPMNHKRKLLSILSILTYLGHISYLTLLPRFDYAYNMAFNLILGVLHNILWTLYALPASISVLKRYPSRPKSYRPSFVTTAGVFVALTTLATSLELFDFPPWGRIIDAHSLWHAVTAPFAFYWYRFLVDDSLDLSWRAHRA